MKIQAGAVELVIMDPTNPRHFIRLYLAYVQRTPYSLNSGGARWGLLLWKSTDGGDSWVALAKHSGFAKGILGNIGVTVSPVNSTILFGH